MSLAYTIAGALKTAIETLTGEPTVAIREQFVVTEGDLAGLPLILIRVDDERDEDHTFGGSVNRFYSFELMVVYARNHQVTGDGQDTARDWREDVRLRVVPDWSATSTALTGVSQAWDVVAVNLPGEDEALARAGYQTSLLAVGVRTNEAVHA